MAPCIDPCLGVGSRRAASGVVHAVGMYKLDRSRWTVRNIDRVPGAFVSQMPERVGVLMLREPADCDVREH